MPLAPKCFALTRDQKKQPDPWRLKQVKKGVEALVTRAVGNHQRMLVEYFYEAWRIALGRDIHPTVYVATFWMLASRRLCPPY
jgi:hypothetical protein